MKWATAGSPRRSTINGPLPPESVIDINGAPGQES